MGGTRNKQHNENTPADKQRHRKRGKGFGLVLSVGSALLGLMVASVAVDVGSLSAEQAHLQSAADAAALAAVQEFVHSNSNNANNIFSDARSQASSIANTFSSSENPVSVDSGVDISFGYVDPFNPSYNANTFNTASDNPNFQKTGGFNAAHIRVRRTEGSPAGPFPTMLAQLFGVNGMDVQADAVAYLDNNIGEITSGVRPFFALEEQYERAMQDGDITNDRIRILGKRLKFNGRNVSGAPSPPSGNEWGFANFRQGCPLNITNQNIATWIEDGFGAYPQDNPVSATGDYGQLSGSKITDCRISHAIRDLKNNRTEFMIPLIKKTKNGHAYVDRFTGFVITNYRVSSNRNRRYVDGHFTETVCSNNCRGNFTADTSGNNVYKIRLIS